MAVPVRIQLSRRKGFDLQAASRAVNGLRAVSAARPHLWGNPYRVGAFFTAEEAVEAFREAVEERLAGPHSDAIRFALQMVRGQNLACWCKPGQPCHADVLLELANAGDDRVRPVSRDPASREPLRETTAS